MTALENYQCNRTVGPRFSDYSPKNHGVDGTTESCEEYVTRLQSIFPHLPYEFLMQWFWGHPRSVENHLWLDFGSLTVSKQLLETSAVIDAKFEALDRVAKGRHDYYERGIRSEKTQLLHRHFAAHGTWPVPPILLRNQSGNVSSPDGAPCGIPLHLIEGANRMAHFLEFHARGISRDFHEVFVIEVDPWVQRVRQASVKFRKRFLEMPKDFRPLGMTDFPRGSCGRMTTLLGSFLKREGLGVFTYVCAERGEECGPLNDWTSHAWLEKDGLIVDVTADQFDDCKDEVIVTTDSDFHRSFVVTPDSCRELEIIELGGSPDLVATYEYLVNE